MSTKGLAFQVQEVHHPKTHQEWEASANRFVIATVRVLECPSKPALTGRLVKYKGTLPSLAPYIIFHVAPGGPQCALVNEEHA
jgi:hypothetical protein